MIDNNSEEKTSSGSQKNYLIYVIITAAVLGLISQILSYHFNYNYVYRDAIYRMEAARRFFDSVNPGFINQLGSVWLPIPNIILMPFAYVDYLWQTGLAASIVNFPSFVISAVVIFLAIKKLTNNNTAAWFGFLVYALNYNILYFQTTAMTEQYYLTFLICSFYFLLLWSYDKKFKYLIYSSIFLALNVGTRYDAWPVVFVSIIIVFIISFSYKDRPVFNTLMFSLLPVLFILLWVFYNWIYYGDPLDFVRGPYSTLHQLKYYEENGRLLTKYNFTLSSKVYFSSVLLYSGLIYIILGSLGLIIYLFKNRFSTKSFPIYILLIALPTTLLLLYRGQLIIEIPDSEPPGYFNSRYGLYLFPAIAVLSGFAFSYFVNLKIKIIHYLFFYFFIIQQLLFFTDFPTNIPAIAEAKYFNAKTSEDLSWFLKNSYKGGKILYDNVIFALHPWSGIDLADRISFQTYEIGKKALENPSEYANWVLFYTKASNDNIYKAMKNNVDFLNNFELKFEEYGVEVYQKK